MDKILEQLPLTYAESPLLYWVLGSVLAYALATNALWLARSGKLGLPAWSGWSIQAVRFAFYLGIPYLALGGWPLPPFSALLAPQDMGLVGLGGRWPPTRWLGALGTGIGFGLVTFLVLLLAWTSANRARDNAKLRFPTRPWWLILADVIYLEMHWAFYRGALSVELGAVYPGVFLGLALVYLEWVLNPFWRSGWRGGTWAASQWLRAAMALVAAVLFLFTRNLWVCLAVHLALEGPFWAMGRERTPAETLVSAQGDNQAPEAVGVTEPQ